MTIHRTTIALALLLASGPVPLLAAPAGREAAPPAGASKALADFTVTVATVTVAPGATVSVPLTLDHDIDGLGVYSIQYTLNHNAAYVTAASVGATGLVALWGQPFSGTQSGKITVATGGSQPLGPGTDLHDVSLTVSSSAPPGTDVPLTLTGFLANEGTPSATLVAGVLQIRGGADVPREEGARLALAARPNPAWREAALDYSIPASAREGEPVRLAIYGLDGRRVRVLEDGPAGPGARHASWDGRDDRGRPQPPGLYFVRLEWRGQSRQLKLVLAR